MTTKYTDLIDPKTHDHAKCGCEDKPREFAQDGQCNDKIYYYLDVSRAPETKDFPDDAAYFKLFREVFDEVERTCGTRFIKTEDKNKAVFNIRFGRTSGSVLAWSNVGFSCGGGAQQLYGTKWDWSWDFLKTTALHEVGHLLGLPHDRCYNGKEANVMCWKVQEYVTKYDSVTARKLQKIYGPPLEKPEPDPTPTPPKPQPQPDPDYPDWPFELYDGETIRNFFKIIANLVWYFFAGS